VNAMILAAGLGTRMAPLTQSVPKPALPILGEPMIASMVKQLAREGIERVVVNTHAHAQVLEDVLANAPIPVTVSREDTLLGSAGGVRAARTHLEGSGPFLVLNADMRIELEIANLCEAHHSHQALITLLLRDDPRKDGFGTIGYSEERTVCRITDRISLKDESGSGLFTGVQVMDPEIFDYLPERPISHLVSDLYVPLLRAGNPIGAALQDERRAWWPVGTPRELLDANLRALDEAAAQGDTLRVHPSATLAGHVEGPAWVGADVHVPEGARLGPYVVVGSGTVIPPGYRAQHTLFLGGARPPVAAADVALERAIAHGREVWRDA